MLRATFLKRTDERIQNDDDENDEGIVRFPHDEGDRRRDEQNVNERTRQLPQHDSRKPRRFAPGSTFGPCASLLPPFFTGADAEPSKAAKSMSAPSGRIIPVARSEGEVFTGRGGLLVPMGDGSHGVAAAVAFTR